jgi:hypothetical protein
MFAHRTATGLTLALLALPATATAKPLTDDGGGSATPAPSSSQPYSNRYGWGGDPHPRTAAPTSGLAGTTSQSFVSPDAADAARAGDIATATEHYERSQPAPATAKPASHTGDDSAWPEIAFAGIVVLAAGGGLVRVRMHRARRVAA